MGTGVILLLFYMSPTIYADPDPNLQSAHLREIYVPKTPRRAMVLVWPSVMNPVYVPNEEKEKYLRIECREEREERGEIMQLLLWMDEIPKKLKFWEILIPRLIDWLSSEVIECGIYTIFSVVRQEIYRFIKANRANWVNTLQELVYILLQVIAVIHNKTFQYNESSYILNMTSYRHLNWIENWENSYEHWYTHEPKSLNKFEEYFRKFVLNSFDIVTAWLVDHMGQRAGVRPNLQLNFCALSHRPDNCSFSFRPNLSVQTEWELSNDSDIMCALRRSEYLHTLERSFPFNWLLEALDPPDRIKAMAHAFIKCEVKSGCKNKNYDESDDESDHEFAINLSKRMVHIPEEVDCIHKCTSFEKRNNVFKPNQYALLDVTAEHLEYFAYAHAHMTTAVAHKFICKIGKKIGEKGDIRTACQPQIVGRYLYEREYKYCCKKKPPCCSCEDVIGPDDDVDVNLEEDDDDEVFKNFLPKKNITLKIDQQTFSDF